MVQVLPRPLPGLLATVNHDQLGSAAEYKHGYMRCRAACGVRWSLIDTFIVLLGLVRTPESMDIDSALLDKTDMIAWERGYTTLHHLFKIAGEDREAMMSKNDVI